jgi:serine/threonine protein kinase
MCTSSSFVCLFVCLCERTEAADLIRSLLQLDPHKRASMEAVRHHKWLNLGYPGPPPTHMSERGPITDIDPNMFSQLLAYGFEADEAEKALHANQPNIVFNFYHLLCEKQRRDALAALGHDPLSTSESESEDERDAVMVRNVDTDEVMSVKRVENSIRRQIMRRQSSQHYPSDKRTDEGSMSAKSGTT